MNHDACDHCGKYAFLTWLKKTIFVCDACLDNDEAKMTVKK